MSSLSPANVKRLNVTEVTQQRLSLLSGQTDYLTAADPRHIAGLGTAKPNNLARIRGLQRRITLLLVNLRKRYLVMSTKLDKNYLIRAHLSLWEQRKL